jgi:hypothetical protein
MCSAPSEQAYKPEISVVRAGAQTGAQDQTCVYVMPRAASPSIFGVVAYWSP